MLFNSYEFIFIFLPFVVLSTFCFLKFCHSYVALTFLFLSSILFYAYWNIKYLVLLLASISFNYVIACLIGRYKNSSKIFLLIGVWVNLLILIYYKYINFFLEVLSIHIEKSSFSDSVGIPLGISFFTFTQIAYLMDIYQRKAEVETPVRYGLFVTFFPHLIAGPILHHKIIMKQFWDYSSKHINPQTVSIGASIFCIGLFKKVIIADTLSGKVDLLFSPLFDINLLTFGSAWFAALGYTVQLYFDFSGYSDMAYGLAYMFGIVFPINFYSPYKADSIIDFWRRWHMTLSQFLRDYIYFPLGGNRKTKILQYRNILVTMALGGLWHGAGWTFILWGVYHGVLLIINHQLRSHSYGLTIPRLVKIFLTFMIVCLGWVVFRASTVSKAIDIYKGMVGINGIGMTDINYIEWAVLTLGLCIVFIFPNTIQIFSLYVHLPSFKSEAIGINSIKWRPNLFWALALAVIGVISITSLSKVSSFLYYQF